MTLAQLGNNVRLHDRGGRTPNVGLMKAVKPIMAKLQSMTKGDAEMIPPNPATTGPMPYYHEPREPMTADRFAERFAGTGAISPNQSTNWQSEQRRQGGLIGLQTRLADILYHVYRTRQLKPQT